MTQAHVRTPYGLAVIGSASHQPIIGLTTSICLDQDKCLSKLKYRSMLLSLRPGHVLCIALVLASSCLGMYIRAHICMGPRAQLPVTSLEF